MKVCLINPPSPFLDKIMGPPLGLCYVSSFLRLCGIEDQVGIDFGTELNLDLIPMDCDYYLISGTTPQYHWTKQIVQHLEDKHVIAGGPHAVNCPDDFPKVMTLGQLGRYLVGQVHPSSIDKLPFPNRSLFSLPYSRTLCGEPAHHIVTLSGCPYHCLFCDKSSGHRVVFRDIGNVLAEMDTLGKHFVIYDDIFTLKMDRLERFCEAFKERDIKWRCWSRANMLNEDKLLMMRLAGLQSITIGIESFSNKILQNINKDCTQMDNVAAIDACKKTNVPVRCSLMFGNPSESKETVDETIKWVERLQPDEWNLAVLKPIPGSAFWTNPERYGLTFDKQRVIDSDYRELNRFEDNGVGNVMCSFPDTSKEELQELLVYFVNRLEEVCPRKKVQDTIQDINI